jgi:ubiquinone/menaquinone biosynthesis C-methylase UbiE
MEHVAGDPQRAIDEAFRVLRPGGLAIHTTCFINPIHEGPGDFWRFTPAALRLLCTRFSSVIKCGGWGNPYVWIVVWLGLRRDAVPRASSEIRNVVRGILSMRALP